MVRAEPKGNASCDRSSRLSRARRSRDRGGPHDREHGVGRGNVHQLGAGGRIDMGADPMRVVGGETGAGHQVEAVVGQPGHGKVALDAAVLVEHLGVDQPARTRRDTVGAQPPQRRRRIRTHQFELGEAGLVEHADPLANRPVFTADRLEPVLAAEAVSILGRLPLRGKPVGALPAELLAETGARLLKSRRTAASAGTDARWSAPPGARRWCSACRRPRGCGP